MQCMQKGYFLINLSFGPSQQFPIMHCVLKCQHFAAESYDFGTYKEGHFLFCWTCDLQVLQVRS